MIHLQNFTNLANLFFFGVYYNRIDYDNYKENLHENHKVIKIIIQTGNLALALLLLTLLQKYILKKIFQIEL